MTEQQRQDNVLQGIEQQGEHNVFNFAPKQIANNIETQILQISTDVVTQKELNITCPYKGLRRYNFGDRKYFFGRDTLIKRLVQAINERIFTLVLGASGSGKSSLIRAGVIPEFKKSLGIENKFNYFIFTPGQDPYESLYRCLLSEEKDYHFSEGQAEICKKGDINTLEQVIESLKQHDERWLIFIDQFEQIFTSSKNSDRCKNFIEGLVRVSQQKNMNVRLILAMRSDFLEQFSFYPGLGIQANDNMHLITEMYPDQLREAIEQPAALHGVVFEAGLVNQIIKEIEGQSGYLPLLQYTLSLLWEYECKTIETSGQLGISDRHINKSSYKALEGVRGALQKRINDIYADFSQDEKLAAKKIFLKLVDIVESDSGDRAISRRAYREEFSEGSLSQTLSRFVDENLIISSDEYIKGEAIASDTVKEFHRKAVVELAHEIILSSWRELKKWLEEEKEAIILKNWVAAETRRWLKIRLEDENKAKHELLKGLRLEQISDFRNKNAFERLGGLTVNESQYIDESVEEYYRVIREEQIRQQRELEQERKARKVAQSRNKIAIVFSLLLISLTTLSISLSRTARIRSINASMVASESLLLAGKEIEALIELINTGNIINQPFFPINNARKRFRLHYSNLLTQIREKNRVDAHNGWGMSVDTSAQQQLIVTGGADKAVKVWRLDGSLLQSLKGHTRSVVTVAINSEGTKIASAGLDNTIRIWQQNKQGTFDLSEELERNTWTAELIFSPDGKSIAAAGADGSISILSSEGSLIKSFSAHRNKLLSIDFNPNGNLLASGANDGSLVVLDTISGGLIEKINLGGEISGLRFIDNKTIASAISNKKIEIRAIEGELIETFERSGLEPIYLDVSNDGQYLVSANKNSSISVLNLNTLKFESPLEGHDDTVTEVVFGGEQETLLSVSHDGTMRMWDFKGVSSMFNGTVADYNSIEDIVAIGDGKNINFWDSDTNLIRAPISYEGEIYDINFLPDKERILIVGEDKVDILDPIKENYLTSEIQNELVSRLDYNDKVNLIATVNLEGVVKLWNQEGKLLRKLNMHEGQVVSVRFSPNGQQLATANEDGLIRILDLRGKTLHILNGHKEPVLDVAYSFKENLLASASSDKVIKIWQLSRKSVQMTLTGHNSSVSQIAFSPKHDLLASASDDGIIKIWDLDGNLLQTFSAHNDAMFSLEFISGGNQLLSAGYDNRVIVWDLQLQNQIKKSCSWLNDFLSKNPRNILTMCSE